MAAGQGFKSNNGDLYVYQELASGLSASAGVENGSNTYKISVSTLPNSSPASTAQIEIDPTTNIMTLRSDTGTVLVATTAVLRIQDLTAGVMQTNATGVVSSSNGTNGQLLIGGGAAPVWANLTSSGGSVTITNGANSINLEASGTAALTNLDGDTGTATPTASTITIAGGNAISTSATASTVTIAALNATTSQIGVSALATNAETIAGSVTDKIVTPDDLKAKLGTQTNHGVLVGAGQTAAVTALAVGTTNTVLVGNTGADPSFGQVPNGALVNSTITLNNGANITVTGSPIALGGAGTVALSGTTNHAVQVGNSSGSLTSLAVGSNGQVMLAATAADPAFASLTSSGGTITYTTGANSLNLDGTPATTTQAGVLAIATNAETIAGTVTNKAVTPDDLKAKLGTQTNHGVLVGAGTSTAVTALSVGATNTVLLGNTGADPSFGTVPNAALTNSSITINAGNNISVSTSPVSLGGSTTVSVVGTTNHAVQVGNASASLTSLAVGLNGQILIGATGLNPAFANMTSSDGSITITTGANTLDIKTAAAAGVSSVTGTTNQVTASPTTGAVTVSTPTTFIAPGTIASTTTNAAGTNFLMPTTSSTVGQIIQNGVRVLHSMGTENIFVGAGSGNLTLSTSAQNTCIGVGSGASLTAATGNNTFVGWHAGALDDGAGGSNTAVGHGAFAAFTGVTVARNACVGGSSLSSLTTGRRNCALGFNAGASYTGAESDNIILGGLNTGTLGESNVLRIGNGTGTSNGNLNKAIVCGIQGITVTGTAVLVSSSDQLGVAVSSRRFKDNIQDMDDYSSNLLKLRPVTFTYNVGEDQSVQSGLIAEEVADVMPQLVVYDQQELPQTVKYHDLAVLLLNEVQKMAKKIAQLEERL